MGWRAVRRFIVLMALAAAASAVIRALRGPEAPAFVAAPPDLGRPLLVAVPDPEPDWVEPVDGACPEGYPVKVKLTSGIFHLPGMQAYDRTQPDRCYRDGNAAEADGYRVAKR
jgi:micrococcal nuclease